jgi:hypothetical protein
VSLLLLSAVRNSYVFGLLVNLALTLGFVLWCFVVQNMFSERIFHVRIVTTAICTFGTTARSPEDHMILCICAPTPGGSGGHEGADASAEIFQAAGEGGAGSPRAKPPAVAGAMHTAPEN